MTAFSAFAYALIVTLAALCCRHLVFGPAMGIRPLFSAREMGACLCVIAAFLFIPPGSLPPFCNASRGGVAFLFLVGLSVVVNRRRGIMIPFLAVLLAASTFFWHARQRGLPGSFTNLGTLAAMPVWSVAFPTALSGFALLALGTAFAAASFAPRQGENRSLAASGQFLAVCALGVTLFFPLNCAPFVQWPDMAAAGCDFLLFWLKTLILCFGVHRLGRFRHAGRIAFACNAAGAAVVLFSLRPQ